MDGLDLPGRGRTTFIIAHRLSTVRRADLIVVLRDEDRGAGSFAELVGRPGLFAHLHRLQTGIPRRLRRLSSLRRHPPLHLAGQYPLGGVGWQALHHLVALRRLGHDVYYVEDSGAPPYAPRLRSVVEDCTSAVDFLKRTMDRFDLGERWAYCDGAGGAVYGLGPERLERLYGEADASSTCVGRRLRESTALSCRIYLATTPCSSRFAHGVQRTPASWTQPPTRDYGQSLGRPGARFHCRVCLCDDASRRCPISGSPAAPCLHFTTWGLRNRAGHRYQAASWSKHENSSGLDLPR